jgi:transcription initiation factor TFIIF subunit beta
MQRRIADSTKPKRTTMQTNESSSKTSYLLPINETEYSIRKKQKANPDLKRERLPKEDVMNILFAAFEKYSYWNLKGLVQHSDQPVSYLKEILNEICIFNQRGPYKNMYQLKPEYKKVKVEKTSDFFDM